MGELMLTGTGLPLEVVRDVILLGYGFYLMRNWQTGAATVASMAQAPRWQRWAGSVSPRRPSTACMAPMPARVPCPDNGCPG